MEPHTRGTPLSVGTGQGKRAEQTTERSSGSGGAETERSHREFLYLDSKGQRRWHQWKRSGANKGAVIWKWRRKDKGSRRRRQGGSLCGVRTRNQGQPHVPKGMRTLCGRSYGSTNAKSGTRRDQGTAPSIIGIGTAETRCGTGPRGSNCRPQEKGRQSVFKQLKQFNQLYAEGHTV